MENVAQIDFKQPYSKIVEVIPARILKQKVFFKQNGIDYDIAGKAVDVKQVTKFYDQVAADAQAQADAAKEAAVEAARQAKEVAAEAKAAVTGAKK